MRSVSETTKRMVPLCATAILLAGCPNPGTPIAPQILTFNYLVTTVSNADALITSVQNGQTTVADLLARDPCNFTADFASATPPQVFPYGTPGQTGFNVNIDSTAPVNITRTNPAYCTPPAELEINIGGQAQALALGVPTNLTNGRVWLTDGRRFATSQFFQASIQGFDPANRRSNGDFRFIDRLTPGSNTVLIVDGSYALTP
jgi:hypothetical protein